MAWVAKIKAKTPIYNKLFIYKIRGNCTPRPDSCSCIRSSPRTMTKKGSSSSKAPSVVGAPKSKTTEKTAKDKKTKKEKSEKSKAKKGK